MISFRLVLPLPLTFSVFISSLQCLADYCNVASINQHTFPLIMIMFPPYISFLSRSALSSSATESSSAEVRRKKLKKKNIKKSCRRCWKIIPEMDARWFLEISWKLKKELLIKERNVFFMHNVWQFTADEQNEVQLNANERYWLK